MASARSELTQRDANANPKAALYMSTLFACCSSCTRSQQSSRQRWDALWTRLLELHGGKGHSLALNDTFTAEVPIDRSEYSILAGRRERVTCNCRAPGGCRVLSFCIAVKNSRTEMNPDLSCGRQVRSAANKSKLFSRLAKEQYGCDTLKSQTCSKQESRMRISLFTSWRRATVKLQFTRLNSLRRPCR